MHPIKVRRYGISLLLLICSTGLLNGQEYSINLDTLGSSNISLKTIKKEEILFTSYPLLSIVEELYPLGTYEIDNNVSKMRFNLKIIGKVGNEKQNLIEEINFLLQNNFAIQIENKSASQWTLTSKMNSVECQPGVLKSINEINRVWHGKCVTLYDISLYVNKTYGINIIPKDTISKFSEIKLYYSSLEQTVNDLKSQGILLSPLDSTTSSYNYIYTLPTK